MIFQVVRAPHIPLDPRMRMIDPLAISTVKPIPKDRFFFSCNCSFSIPGVSSDTSKHDEVYDSAICSWKTNVETSDPGPS